MNYKNKTKLKYFLLVIFLLITTFMLRNKNLFFSWLIFSFLMLVGGTYLYRVILQPKQYLSRFTRLSLTSIAHMPIGMVLLKGRFITESPKMKVPFLTGEYDGYAYEYYKGHWQKDGTIEYELDHKEAKFNPFIFQDSSGEIDIDAAAIRALRGNLEEIKIGNDLIRIFLLDVDKNREYVIGGNYQVQDGEAILVGDPRFHHIHYIASDEFALLKHRQKHAYLFQKGRLYGIIAAIIALLSFIFLDDNSSINYLGFVFFYFIGNIVIAFAITKIYGVKGVENDWVNLISLSLFPNVGLICMAILLNIGLAALLFAMVNVLSVTWIFVNRYRRQMLAYWQDRPKINVY